MQDRPSAPSLLKALQHFLAEHAAPQLTGHAAFHARVAGNVLDILAREAELGQGFAKAEQTRLQALLGQDGSLAALNTELCRRIAGGEMDLATPGLQQHLIKTTMGKLAIDQPRYQGYKTAQANNWPEEDILE